MKTLALTLVLCALPFLAEGHPGKTDRYGGHQCIKDCAEWDLYYREYHLHDKEGRPVRVAQKKKRATGNAPAAAETVLPVQAPAPPSVVQASVLPVAAPPDEADALPVHWAVVLLLLLLLLLLRLRRSRNAENGS